MLKDFYGNVVTAEQFSEVENKWQKYWKEYCEKVPDADGDDYTDEREMFMMSELGGDFKHM